jgi:PAS domain S-box-containing protein
MAEAKAAIEFPGRRPAQKHLREPLMLQPLSLDKAAVAPSPESALPAEIELPRVRSRNSQAAKNTKQTASGQSLRDSEVRYRRLFEAAQDGILILDAKKAVITDVNPFLIKLLDYSREEFLGKALWEIGLFKDVEASKAAIRELQANKYVRYDDLPLKTRGGHAINVEFVSNVYRVNGKNVIQCNVRDITKRKHAEQSDLQHRQSQKMEAVGQLAGGVAHDFNNLLGVILVCCEMLGKQSDLAEGTRKMIVDIEHAGTSAKDLTRHLLAFSRRQALQPMLLDLNTSVNRIATMLNRLIGDDIELESILADDLGVIKADPIQIEQVLMNLAVNARDAMPKGGKITIETANVQIDEAFAREHASAKPGPYVMLTVSDTGDGMDKETQSRIFEPFFSTKTAGKGTGLGLSTVFDIIEQSAAAITVHSEPGRGTTFNCYFPRCEELLASKQPEQTTPILGGSETILLVDDATPLRELTRRLLEDCGYTVLDSGSPVEALGIAGKHDGPLPLMITDVEMPGFSGAVLAEKLTAVRPETKVLYTSGYVRDAGARLGQESAFLEKPYTRDELVRTVRELLDSAKTSMLPGRGNGVPSADTPSLDS